MIEIWKLHFKMIYRILCENNCPVNILEMLSGTQLDELCLLKSYNPAKLIKTLKLCVKFWKSVNY